MSNSDGKMIASPKKFDHVSEDNICRLDDAFYGKIRTHPELGPVFARAIPGD